MNRDQLISSGQALLDLDARGALVPHGIGGHARSIIEGFIALERPPAPDQTNAEVSDERLLEIIDGCEGVTPGPWTFGAQWLCAKAPTLSDYKYLAQVPLNDYDSARWNVDAAHIARLDPATVKALATELLNRRSVTSQASEGAASDEQVEAEVDTTQGEIAEANFAIGDAVWVLRLAARVTAYRLLSSAASPSPSKRVERLETALKESRQWLQIVADEYEKASGEPQHIADTIARIDQALQGGRS